MDGNPWGDAWAEVEPQKPPKDIHVSSISSPPPSADITTSWSDNQPAWGSQSEILEQNHFTAPKETFQPIFESATYVPWGSPPTTSHELSADTELPAQETEEKKDEEEDKDQEQPVQEDIEDKTQEEEKIGRWSSLGNAAITVGDDAAWETAWTPAQLLSDQTEKVVEEDERTPPFQASNAFEDEWSHQANQTEQITRSYTSVPAEVIDSIIVQSDELSKTLWPDHAESLQAARDHPASRDEWQGGLENVDGFMKTVNNYLSAPSIPPPIHFSTTTTARSFHTAMKMTKSYAMIQKSPLARMASQSDTWESTPDHRSPTTSRFSIQEWVTGDSTALTTTIPSNISQESTAVAVASAEDAKSLLGAVTGATSAASGPSAVSRFLNRWSRRSEDRTPPLSTPTSSKQSRPTSPANGILSNTTSSTPVSLRSDELDFLDMAPGMVNLAKSTTGTLLDGAGLPAGLGNGYPGSAAMAAGINAGGLFMPTGSSSAKNSAATSIRGLTSEAFDELLDRQIAEVEEEKIRESLASAAFMDPIPGTRYGKFGLPLGGLFGSSRPQHSQSLDASTNTLLDDDEDDLDAFLSAPQGQAKAPVPVQPSVIPTTTPMAPLSYGNSNTTTSPTGSLRQSPLFSGSGSRSAHNRTPSLTSTVAIMSQSNPRNSRPSTPSLGNAPIAPLLPPPPGSRPVSLNTKSGHGMTSLMGSVDLFNDFGSNASAPLPAPVPVSAFGKTSPIPIASISSPPSRNQNQTNITQFGNIFDLGSPPSSSSPAIQPMPARTPVISSTPTGGSQWSLPKPAQFSNTTTATTTKTTATTATTATTTTAGGLSAQDLSFFEGL